LASRSEADWNGNDDAARDEHEAPFEQYANRHAKGLQIRSILLPGILLAGRRTPLILAFQVATEDSTWR